MKFDAKNSSSGADQAVETEVAGARSCWSPTRN